MHCFVKETRNSIFQHRLFAFLINGWSLLLKTLKWILDIVLSRSSCAISVDLNSDFTLQFCSTVLKKYVVLKLRERKKNTFPRQLSQIETESKTCLGFCAGKGKQREKCG